MKFERIQLLEYLGIYLQSQLDKLSYNDYQHKKSPNQMKKYETIKRIDLMDRDSMQHREKQLQSRLHSLGRSSQKNKSRQQSDYAQCFTDRSKNEKINQFSLGQNTQATHSQFPNNSVKSNIKTYIRFKPFTKQEIMDSSCSQAESGIDIVDEKKIIIDQNLCFTFDRVFEPESSQKSLYETTAKQIVKSFVNGYNGTIFAYGQTGSGKTYTMFGGDQSSTNGIIPQAIEGLFTEIQAQKLQGIKKITLTCSMYEIYKEIICDLMAEKQKQIKIKQSANGSVQIQNLTVRQVFSKEELLDWINKGSQLRRIRGTEVNERSSRSHLIFTLYLNAKLNDFQSKNSKLNLVDLAGSEKVSKTKVSGEGLEEAIKINLSLSCLGNAIYALSRGQEHVPFRDSKLTRVLQQSLSGNSITRVIVTCSMLPSCKQQTISSLKFANRIKTIKTCSSQNLKKMNEVGVNKFMYQTLKASFQSCEQKLEKIKILVDMNGSKMSKDQVIDFIKSIIYSEEKCSSENQFLQADANPFETFRSPCKEESATYQDDQPETNLISKDESKTLHTESSLQDHIKNLECILIKQEKIIQRQTSQILQLKKQIEKNQQNSQNQHKKITQKLKILKTNASSSNIGLKLKQLKSLSKEGKLGESKQTVTYKTKYDESNKKNKDQNRDMFSQLKQVTEKFNECLKQKSSYENMEKEILMKQVKALGVQVNHWRKMFAGDAENKNLPPGAILTDISNKLAMQATKEQSILKARLEQKDIYIYQLEKIIAAKIQQENICSIKKKTSLQEPLDLGAHHQIKRKIDLFTSPTASTLMSRINSAKNLTKI